jgi:hypothetical protein
LLSTQEFQEMASMIRMTTAAAVAAAAFAPILAGCGGSPAAPTAASPVSSAAPSQAPAAAEPTETPTGSTEPATVPRRRPVQLGGGGSAAASNADKEQQAESVLSAMQPLQILLGKWNGASRKAQIDEPEWIWDFQTNRAQPSLVMTSEKGTYIREGRLTYLPEVQKYQFSWKTPEGEVRVLRGEFVKPVQDVPGDDNKLQRTFKLQLTGDPQDGEQWQLAFDQQENNRYILEVERRRGSGAFQRVDTVHTQREGTSFALSSSDYGEKTCIISQGLGVMTVSYKGQSYYVCCTGCKAAFEDDPEGWIAKWEAKKKSMKE